MEVTAWIIAAAILVWFVAYTMKRKRRANE
jgi:hypothetical protein